MAPKFILLFTKAGWSAQPYPINFGLSSTLAFPSAYLEAAFTLAPFFIGKIMKGKSFVIPVTTKSSMTPSFEMSLVAASFNHPLHA